MPENRIEPPNGIFCNGRWIVRYGVTDDPHAREQEQQRSYDKPTLKLTVEGQAVTRESALAWDARTL